MKRGTFVLFIAAFLLAVSVISFVTSRRDTFRIFEQLRPSLTDIGYPFSLCSEYKRNEFTDCENSPPRFCYNPWNGSTQSEHSFTMVIQTYNRTDILPKVLSHYCAIGPPLKLIVLVWNNVNITPPYDLWAHLCQIKVLIQAQNKMRNRLHLFPEIEGKGIGVRSYFSRGGGETNAINIDQMGYVETYVCANGRCTGCANRRYVQECQWEMCACANGRCAVGEAS